MFDYSRQIEAFRKEKVRLSAAFRRKLLDHRDANRARLVSRLPERISGVRIGMGSFRPQGSAAVGTIIQTRFAEEEYDIDDGLVLDREDLVDGDDQPLSAMEVKERVREALKDARFARQPRLCTNAVRVFYRETDEEKHHVDFPVYRRFEGENGGMVRELASADSWIESDPTQVNRWWAELVEERNELDDGRGTQMRRLAQLLKRFCRSRRDWDMPNGMKLTMLVAECQPPFNPRIDQAFRSLLEAIDARLAADKVIRNLAHPGRPPITRTGADANVRNLHERVGEALQKLAELDEPSADLADARTAWDWIFRSDGYFAEFDEKEARDRKAAALTAAHSLIATGAARTGPTGAIGLAGVCNLPHRFYGETF